MQKNERPPACSRPSAPEELKRTLAPKSTEQSWPPTLQDKDTYWAQRTRLHFDTHAGPSVSHNDFQYNPRHKCTHHHLRSARGSDSLQDIRRYKTNEEWRQARNIDEAPVCICHDNGITMTHYLSIEILPRRQAADRPRLWKKNVRHEEYYILCHQPDISQICCLWDIPQHLIPRPATGNTAFQQPEVVVAYSLQIVPTQSCSIPADGQLEPSGDKIRASAIELFREQCLKSPSRSCRKDWVRCTRLHVDKGTHRGVRYNALRHSHNRDDRKERSSSAGLYRSPSDKKVTSLSLLSRDGADSFPRRALNRTWRSSCWRYRGTATASMTMATE